MLLHSTVKVMSDLSVNQKHWCCCVCFTVKAVVQLYNINQTVYSLPPVFNAPLFLYTHVNESEDTSFPLTDYIYIHLNLGTNQSAVTERKRS